MIPQIGPSMFLSDYDDNADADWDVSDIFYINF